MKSELKEKMLREAVLVKVNSYSPNLGRSNGI